MPRHYSHRPTSQTARCIPYGVTLTRASAGLKDEAGKPITQARVSTWLKTQESSVVHKPAPRQKEWLPYEAKELNEYQQMDIVVMMRTDPEEDMSYPNDKGKKYWLQVIDIYTRYAEAEPMVHKSAEATLAALKKIYARSPLKPPKYMQSDEGGEYLGVVAPYLKANGLVWHRQGVPGVHESTALVDRVIQTFKQRLGRWMSTERELRPTVRPNWPAYLPNLVRAYNTAHHETMGHSPQDVIDGSNCGGAGTTTREGCSPPKKPRVIKVKPSKDKLPKLDVGQIVRIAQNNAQGHRDIKGFRAGLDEKWSRQKFVIIRWREDRRSGIRVYYLATRPDTPGETQILSAVFYRRDLTPA